MRNHFPKRKGTTQWTVMKSLTSPASDPASTSVLPLTTSGLLSPAGRRQRQDLVFQLHLLLEAFPLQGTKEYRSPQNNTVSPSALSGLRSPFCSSLGEQRENIIVLFLFQQGINLSLPGHSWDVREPRYLSQLQVLTWSSQTLRQHTPFNQTLASLLSRPLPIWLHHNLAKFLWLENLPAGLSQQFSGLLPAPFPLTGHILRR